MYLCIIISVLLYCAFVFLSTRKRAVKKSKEIYYSKSEVDGSKDEVEVIRETLRGMREGYCRLRGMLIKETSDMKQFNDELSKKVGWHSGMFLVPLKHPREHRGALLAFERFIVQKVVNSNEIYDDSDYKQL